MFPERYIEQYLLQVPATLRDIVLEIRNIVASVAPNATEKQHSRGFSYYHKVRGGPVSAGICQIGIFDDHVRLAFIHGAFLEDPEGRLKGKEKAKRYMPIYNYEEAPWDYIRSLIEAHARFDPYTYFRKNNESA
jgi:hypothetical protein